MKFSIYRKSMIFQFFSVLGLLNAVSIGLAVYFCCKFIESSFDEQWLFVALFMLLPILYFDIIGFTTQTISRFFVKCTVDDDGISCGGFGWRSWFIKWDEICVYGISGYSIDTTHMPLIFLSKDPCELYDKKQIAHLNKNRIVFDIRAEIWSELSCYMPLNMKSNLQWSVENHRDCFHKRKPQNTLAS